MKSQIPNPKSQTNSKFQAPSSKRLVLGIWSLVLVWCLGFGAWNLVFGASLVGAQANPEWIRVAVVQDDPKVTLRIHRGVTIVALHTGERIQQGSRLQQTEVRAVTEGLALGTRVVPVFGVRVEPSRDATIDLNGKRLRGTIEIVRNQHLKLLVVNHVALEEYLQGVLSKEMPHYWPMEALKAVAIAARTYAVYQRLTQDGLD